MKTNTMKTSVTHSGNRGVLTLEGRFDMGSQLAFRNAYRKLLPNIHGGELAVDLGAVDYIDSSALGALLLMREEVGIHDVAVSLVGCKPHIERVLAMAHFNRLFEMAAA